MALRTRRETPLGQTVIGLKSKNKTFSLITETTARRWHDHYPSRFLDKGVGFRDFSVPTAGEYIVRFRAAGKIPTRDEVVTSVKPMLEKRRDDEIAKNPKGKGICRSRI